MIVEYHRPNELSEALRLITREQPYTLPMAGGTVLSRGLRNLGQDVAVVDLQNLDLDQIELDGQQLMIGAAASLQQLYEHPQLPTALRESLRVELGLNLRSMASVAGTIISCDGRSAFVTALLALDPRLEWAVNPSDGNDPQVVEALGDFLALKPRSPFEILNGRIMTEIRVLLNSTLRFETVSRTPLDRPQVCVATAKWPSGRTRVTLGGFGKAPILAMDGPEGGGAEQAARSAFLHAADEWASAEFRAEVAARLAKRLTE